MPLGAREEDEVVVQVVLLGELERGVEVSVHGRIEPGGSAAAVARHLPGITLERPPTQDPHAARSGLREAAAQGGAGRRRAGSAVGPAAEVAGPVVPGDVGAVEVPRAAAPRDARAGRDRRIGGRRQHRIQVSRRQDRQREQHREARPDRPIRGHAEPKLIHSSPPTFTRSAWRAPRGGQELSCATARESVTTAHGCAAHQNVLVGVGVGAWALLQTWKSLAPNGPVYQPSVVEPDAHRLGAAGIGTQYDENSWGWPVFSAGWRGRPPPARAPGPGPVRRVVCSASAFLPRPVWGWCVRPPCRPRQDRPSPGPHWPTVKRCAAPPVEAHPGHTSSTTTATIARCRITGVDKPRYLQSDCCDAPKTSVGETVPRQVEAMAAVGLRVASPVILAPVSETAMTQSLVVIIHLAEG